ncbi:dynein intermediate chain 2, ciliary-like [Penaeus chinensis]|uniref:dynein intermediate chain 2, ciliary-like n=1 Tax=Penaeus chinensis TaxID=139456 RepID=UPI001FB7B475|nr:dynein intermediate chain 2, ciliary-like [Penaeus chinensis]
MLDLYGDIMSREDLLKLDSQPNPFNYSGRVSQTQRVLSKEVAMQTIPPPDQTFSANAGFAEIYDAYEKDYSGEETETPPMFQKPGSDQTSSGLPSSLPLQPPVDTGGEEESDLGPVLPAVMTLERMVNQNIFDDVTQDYKYWEDISDEHRNLEGSLLPLWKFTCDGARLFVVADICWSPFYHDLFIAAYMSETTGIVISDKDFKNTVYIAVMVMNRKREKRASIMAAGREDGTVIIYDIRSPVSIRTVSSSAVGGKHLLPVCQVRLRVGVDVPGVDFDFDFLNVRFSLGYTQMHGNHPRGQSFGAPLIGVDTGAIFQVRTTCHHSITRYPAHVGAVRNITWNRHHIRVFATCSIDWTLKIWLYNCFSPVVTLDLGSPVACLSWSPYSSSVLAGVSDEGRVYVYDLFLRKCLPLCSQNVTHKRRLSLSCVAFNPFSPIILVGGEKGYLVTHKLSPNLRKPLEETKITDEEAAEIELCKMERILALNQENK